MVSLIQTFGIEALIIVFLVGIPALFSFISWCKGLWAKREKFKSENVAQGRAEEAEAEAAETRMHNLETDVADLKKDKDALTKTLEKQNELINLLIQSDELDIKAWIKTQHEKWVPRGCIDSQTLELLCQRYEIYEKEGGNSWAKKMIEDLCKLPVVTVIPISGHDEK